MEKAGIDPIWGQALEFIGQQVNDGTFRIWFEPTVGLGFSDGVYSIGVASEFAKDWIEQRFQTIINDAVSSVVGEPVRCEIVVSPELSRLLFMTTVAEGRPGSGPQRRSAVDLVDRGRTRPRAQRGAASPTSLPRPRQRGVRRQGG